MLSFPFPCFSLLYTTCKLQELLKRFFFNSSYIAQVSFIHQQSNFCKKNSTQQSSAQGEQSKFVQLQHSVYPRILFHKESFIFIQTTPDYTMAVTAAKLIEPNVSDSSIQFQQRNYREHPFHFDDVANGRKENALAASRWREMLTTVAVHNLGVVIGDTDAANGITILPSTLRDSNETAARRVINLPDNPSEDDWTVYNDKLDKATKAATAIAKDNENIAKRNALAGLILQGWVLQTLTKSGMQNMVDSWRKTPGRFYDHLQEVMA